MFNAEVERDKASALKQIANDLCIEASDLKDTTARTHEIASGGSLDAYVDELVTHANKIVIEADSLSIQVGKVDTAIDLVEAEESVQSVAGNQYGGNNVVEPESDEVNAPQKETTPNSKNSFGLLTKRN